MTTSILIATLALAPVVQETVLDTARVRVAVDPETVTIGDRVALTITVTGVEGRQVIFPALPDSGALAAVGPPVRLSEPGARMQVARYELVAWETGVLRVPRPSPRIVDGATEVELMPPAISLPVASVLPAGGAPDSLELRPARDVMGGNWTFPEKAAAAVLAVLALLFTVVILRRRARRAPIRPPPSAPPRDRALTALRALEDSDLLELGELKAYYSRISEILREFLARAEPRWGLHLTTGELLWTVERTGASDEDVWILSEVLAGADLVKFARHRPTVAHAEAVLETVRRWIDGFEPPEDEEPEAGEMAREAVT